MCDRRRSRVVLMGSLFAVALACAACGDTSISAPVHPADVASRDGAELELSVPIQVSPATLVLDSPGTWVTVHADIAYGDVDHATLTMNGVEVVYVKSDNCGDLVVKFDRRDVQDIVSPPEATLTLTGFTVDGTPFAGSQVIRVE